MNNVYCIGSINVDLTTATFRLPARGETVHGDYFRIGMGGKGLNEAVAISRAGGSLRFLGKVGKDLFGDMALRFFEALNEPDCMVLTNGTSTGIASILLHDHDNRIIVVGGGNQEILHSEVLDFLCGIEKGDYLVAALENNLDAVLLAMKEAKRRGATTILNPSPLKESIADFLKWTDILVLNEGEARAILDLLGLDSEKLDALAANALGVEQLVVTLGPRGARYISASETLCVPGRKVDAVDTVGAGDTFLGYFASGLSRGLSTVETLALAVSASAISVTRSGACDSIPTLEEVLAYPFD